MLEQKVKKEKKEEEKKRGRTYASLKGRSSSGCEEGEPGAPPAPPEKAPVEAAALTASPKAAAAAWM